MIIDCHGHFTTEPASFREHRSALVAFAEGRSADPGEYPGIDDAELADIIEANQLRLQRERGTDVTLISPRASGMGHHVPGQKVADRWARLSNDTIGRITELFPDRFAPVGQLPQVVDGDPDPVIAEMERCVAAGFVGFNLNPDPSGGDWSGPALTEPWWDPIWETLERLRVPAMVHVSATTQHGSHTTGSHYLAGDTIAFMQLLSGDLFERHPYLQLVIPHGGGAAPYHWGRYRGLAITQDKPALSEHLLGNLSFDTCVYHQVGIDLLLQVIGPEHVLFGSELLGAVKAEDPQTGHPFDDTKRYVDAAPISEADRATVFEANARRVYPRLDERLRAQGR
ncbi:amidohydrolase family protein [Kocuria sp. M1N1S27]|uniref:amidohydrolase family protein n=1 Tax=Kocuria kalidii TaxID=3376283 RepID=UPI0037A475E8